MKALLIEPLEPLVLSKNPVASQEFITGSHVVLSVPSPTTIGGLVGFALNVTLEGRDSVDHLSILRNLLENIRKGVVVGNPLSRGRSCGLKT